MKKIDVFIPARGGSKGVPGKNIREIAGKPLIVHSIDYALSSDAVRKVWVSTDSDDIAAIARSAGAEILQRPAELSGDTATTESAVKHALDVLDDRKEAPDILVLLQATSPYRPAGSLDLILKHFQTGGYDSLLTLSPTHRFFWSLKGDRAEAQYDYLHRPRRQDMSSEDIRYVENGSLYCFSTDHFRQLGNRLGGRIGYYIFDEEFAYEIDSVSDFLFLESLMKKER